MGRRSLTDTGLPRIESSALLELFSRGTPESKWCTTHVSSRSADVEAELVVGFGKSTKDDLIQGKKGVRAQT